MVQWLRLHAPNAKGPGSISGWGTRSYRLQLEILHATTKTRSSQIHIIKINQQSFKYWQNQYLKPYVLARGKTQEEVRSGVHSSRALLAGLSWSGGISVLKPITLLGPSSSYNSHQILVTAPSSVPSGLGAVMLAWDISPSFPSFCSGCPLLCGLTPH